MLRRRIWLKSAIAGAIALLPWQGARAQEGNSINAAERLSERHVTALGDQLKNGLRVVSPQQLQFVGRVVLNVNQGRLPRAMVNLVYKWAIERNPRVPFPYFQFAMRILAKRRGVML